MLIDDGFQIAPDVIPLADVQRLLDALSRTAAARDGAARAREGKAFALRNLLQLVPAVSGLAQSDALRNLVTPSLGPGAIPVRGILFDKTPGANWKVAWHQDLSIAVKERHEVEGYGPWSVKAGVIHVQPPVDVLRSMLTVRLHLDDCGQDNGPLRVMPGSHEKGVLNPAAVENWIAKGTQIACTARAGSALLMRPLILHASSSAERPGNRRVVHIEYASPAALHPALAWYVA